MAKKFGPAIKKLQRAINERSEDKLLVNKTQIYHEDSKCICEILVIKKVIWDSQKQKKKYVELFHSTSDIQIVLFLRDYWYKLNGWDVPMDNEEWNKAKNAYIEKQGVK